MTLCQKGLVSFALLVSLMDSTCAEPAKARFDTYFYQAPRYTARVLDEVQTQASLDVLSCDGQWCRVRYSGAEGYVRDLVVHGPQIDISHKDRPKLTDCFRADQPGGIGWQVERFCH
ncbi:SH3 domain-containing protein [Methylobacterium phyllostachyos]|uniref:SH3 domain-containing protein n=2 Tax=Methylobacterium phyllostachyos TaxID=582672 RepID=A0A1G9VYL9_9HYPH|nr:SH3 domain-containing protein [Methylobacterium phyllostachyos]